MNDPPPEPRPRFVSLPGAGRAARLAEAARRTAPSDAEVADATARLAVAWGDVFPATREGIDFADLLKHKVAGYNVGLQGLVRTATEAARSAREVDRTDRARVAVFAPGRADMRERALRDLAESRGARVLHVGGRAAFDRASLVARPSRSDRPDFVPLEVPLAAPSASRPPSATRTCEFLFLATMNNYLNPMIPTIERLRARGRSVAMLLPREADGWKNFARLPQGVPAFRIEDFATPELVAEIERTRGERESEWDARAAEILSRYSIEGFPIGPFVAKDLRRVATELAAHAFAYFEIAGRVARETGARVVLAARLRRAVETSMFAAFRRAGVATALLIHGHVGTTPARRFDDGDFAPADLICAWGERQREAILAAADRPAPEKVLATGPPAWDELAAIRDRADFRSAARRKVAEIVGGAPEARRVLVATQEIAAPQHAALIRAIDDARAKIGAVEIVVKVHPGEGEAGRAFYEATAARAGIDTRVLPHASPSSLAELLAASDLLVTFSSTVNIEALLLDVPVVSAALVPALLAEDRLVRLEEFGLPFATDARALRDAIVGYFAEPAERRRLLAATRDAREALVAGNGRATDRVCDELERLSREVARS